MDSIGGNPHCENRELDSDSPNRRGFMGSPRVKAHGARCSVTKTRTRKQPREQKRCPAVTPAGARLLAEWRLPNSDKPIRLEVGRTVDGYDAPTINLGKLSSWKLLLDCERAEITADVDREDQHYYLTVIAPQAEEVSRAWFFHRARNSFPRLVSKRRGKKVG